MNITYWANYYDIHNNPFTPSDFAKFAMAYVSKGDTLVDLGCGNGRDSMFFASQGINTIGVDQCSNIVGSLNNMNYNNASFISDNFADPVESYYKATHAYSRFSLHSISEEDADSVIQLVKENTSKMFFIEVRSDKDSLVGVKTDHYRRFVNFESLLSKLLSSGFNIRYAELSRGFSKYDSKFNVDYNESDPMLIRIVAENIL